MDYLSLSPHIEWVEINSNRVCCMRLGTDMGHIYLFNVYLPCDTTNHENLCDYNIMLTDIAKCCADKFRFKLYYWWRHEH